MLTRSALVAALFVLSGTWHPPSVAAQSTEPPGPELILQDNSYVVEMNGELFLGYEILGDLEGFVALPSPFEEIDPAEEEALEEALATRSTFEVVVTSHAPIEDRSAVAEVLAGDPGPALDGARINLDEVVQIDELRRPVGFVYAVPTATRGNRASELELVREGLFPISVELWRDGVRIARHITFAERLADPDETSVRPIPFQLAVIAGVSDPGPEPSVADRSRISAEFADLAALASTLRSPITAAIPPSAARILAETPEVAAALTTELRTGEALVLPAFKLDPSSASRAGAAEAFTSALRTGEDQLAALLPEVPLRRTAWPASDRMTAAEMSRAGAGLLRDLGSQLIVVSPDTYLGLAGALPPRLLDTSVWHLADIPGGSTVSLGVLDPIGRLLATSTTADQSLADQSLADQSLTEVAIAVMAEISAQRYQGSSARRVALLATPELGVPDPEVMLRIEEFVERHPLFVMSTASTVAGTVDSMMVEGGTAGVVRQVALPERAGVDLGPRVEDLTEMTDRVALIGSMLLEGDVRAPRWRDSLARWVSTAYSDAQIDSRLRTLGAELDAIPAAIELPEPFTFTLTGRVSEITLRIVNTSPDTLRAVLHSESTKLDFPGGPLTVELAPGVTTVDVGVSTLTNGTFAVQMELRTPSGEPLAGKSLQLTARVNALTGLGQVLTGGAVAVLASWWYSHLRRRRRTA